MTLLCKALRTSLTGAFAAAIVAASLVAPTQAHARVFFSVTVAPPVLPVYDQPYCPGEGYIWTPGYWAYGDQGYFWVDGAWVEAPYQGALWTPGYWAYNEGAYLWNPGYWGTSVGYYGGINYGFGYIGTGFYGGYWNSGRFFYNRGYNHIDEHRIRTIYNDTGHGGTYVHPGGRAFDPHPPAWAGRNEGRGFERNDNRGDDRGSRIADGRDQRSTNNAPDYRQGFHGTPAGPDYSRQGGYSSQGNQGYRGNTQGSFNESNAHTAPAPQGGFNDAGRVQNNHVVQAPDPRQGSYSPEVNRGYPGTPQGQSYDRFSGNAHSAPVPQGGFNNNQGQQNTVQQYRPPQQDRAPQQTNIPQYRVPQQQSYNAAPRPTPQQSPMAQPADPRFDRFQQRTTSAPQTMNAPSPQQQHFGGQGGNQGNAQGFHGSFSGGRR